MSNKWPYRKIEDIAERVGMGPFGSSIKVETFVPDGIPIVSGQHLHGFRLDEEPGFNFISEEHADRLQNANLYRGDVVFTHAGNIENVAYIPKNTKHARYVASQRQFYVRCDLKQVLPSWIVYYFKTHEGKHKLTANSSSVGVPSIAQPVSYLRKLEIPIPPLPEQRAIEGILGALEDKIDINRRMNRTLEAIARALFREWFMDDKEEDGWRVGKLGDVAKNIRRGANVKAIDPETNYIGLEHMPRRSIALPQWGHANELASNKYKFKKGEFLFGKLRPYFHKVGIAPVDGVCSTDILVIAPKSPEWYGFVLGHISSVELINYTNAASTGTKMPRTNWSDIENYEVAIPPVKQAKEFNKIILPMAQRIRANIMESLTLSSVRDNLLPKLMTGEVSIKT